MARLQYRDYMLVVLTTATAVTAFDPISLSLQGIKASFGLSDSQLGLLTGMAFAAFYSLAGMPIARLADRGNRVWVIGVCIGLFGIAVSLCGIAGSFMQLLMLRVGVAVGEAGCLPATNSLLADYFGRSDRPRVVAVSLIGSPVGAMISFMSAGWLLGLLGWRLTFGVLGLPGLLLGTVVLMTLKEPRTKQLKAGRSASSRTPPARGGNTGLATMLRELWANQTYRKIVFGFSVLSFFGGGIAQWQPAFLTRSFGMQPGAIGIWFSVIFGLGGIVGTYCAGYLASRFAAGNEKLQFRGIAAACVLTGIASCLLYSAQSRALALALLALTAVGVASIGGPLFATLQSLVPDRMRALSVSLMYLFSNLIGMGLGPLAVGALSDLLHPYLGQESLRYALVAMCPGYLWTGWHLWRAGETVTRDIREAQAASAEYGQ